jgi:oligopeptide/dipeptide ABC transporter ATP-binding protein
MTVDTQTLVTVNGVSKVFSQPQNWLDVALRRPPLSMKAVDRVSLEIPRGQVVGLVGESGSGKSTLARCIVRLYTPDEGQVNYGGVEIDHLSTRALLPYRRKMQMIFQDPYSSLNPRMTIEATLAEVLDVHHMVGSEARAERVNELLAQVGLSPELGARKPIQLSGGQRQRVGIARALAVGPEFLIADEPVSALDVSIQAQIINLLHQLQQDLHLTMLFISHDLRVVRHISNRVAVMYLGRIVEDQPAEEVFLHPLHPYTQALLAAAPRVRAGYQRRSSAIQGETPSPFRIPPGCRFHTRCPKAMPICKETEPEMREVEPGRRVACHLY